MPTCIDGPLRTAVGVTTRVWDGRPSCRSVDIVHPFDRSAPDNWPRSAVRFMSPGVPGASDGRVARLNCAACERSNVEKPLAGRTRDPVWPAPGAMSPSCGPMFGEPVFALVLHFSGDFLARRLHPG